MSDNWYAGNAADDSTDYRGWMVGHFIDPSHGEVRKTENLEIKWGIHPADEQRVAWTEGEDRSTLVILVSGKFRVDLSVKSVTLERQGDYLTWGPGIEHSWQAEENSVVITVRWPSIP
jgi:D-lyxose ketol-isomerase